MQKVKFKYLSYEGKIKHKVIPVEVPKYETYEADFMGIQLTVQKDSQIMDFLDNLDKRPIMDKYEMEIIFDYLPVYPKKKINKKEETIQIVRHYSEVIKDKQMIVDFVAVYDKMHKTIKKLTPEKQFEIVLNSLKVAYISSTETLKKLSEFNKDLERELDEIGIGNHRDRLKFLKQKREQKRLT